MKRTLTLVILVIISLTACQKQPNIDTKSKPSWILHPNQGGKMGAIGVAGRTYDQRISSQRKLAISRALDELSLQQGVKVEMNMKKQDTLINNHATTDIDSQSSYKTSSTITAHIQSIWKDPLSGDFYVWMLIN